MRELAEEVCFEKTKCAPAVPNVTAFRRSERRWPLQLLRRGDEGVDPGEFKKLLDVRAGSNGDDTNTARARANEMTDDQAEAGGVQCGNVRDVEDVESWAFFAGRGLEFEDVDDSQGLEDAVHFIRRKGSREPEDEDAPLLVLDAFNGKFRTLP